MAGVTRRTANSIRRRAAVFAAIAALCCLPGCGVLQSMLDPLVDDEDSSPRQNPEDRQDSLSKLPPDTIGVPSVLRDDSGRKSQAGNQ